MGLPVGAEGQKRHEARSLTQGSCLPSAVLTAHLSQFLRAVKALKPQGLGGSALQVGSTSFYSVASDSCTNSSTNFSFDS